MAKNADILLVLKEARAVLSQPSAWTQGVLARGIDLKPLKAEDPLACSFCMGGAVHKVCQKLDIMVAHQALQALWAGLGKEHWNNIASYNDARDRTHEEVLAVFDRTIKRLEKSHG